jgi:hypothetical protein
MFGQANRTPFCSARRRDRRPAPVPRRARRACRCNEKIKVWDPQSVDENEQLPSTGRQPLNFRWRSARTRNFGTGVERPRDSTGALHIQLPPHPL